MNKSEFIEKIHSTRQELNSFLSGLSEEQVLQPNTCGDWSIKDLVAHINWHEREMVGVVKGHALVGSELWNLSLDQRNAAIHALNRGRSWEEVRAGSSDIFRELMECLPSLTEEDLVDASLFPGMPADWLPRDVIASNTYEHYADHLVDLRKAFPANT